MRGDSESASKNTSKPFFKYPKHSIVRIFENSLASDIVFVAIRAEISCPAIQYNAENREDAPEKFNPMYSPTN